jgi:hypothetical protein
MEDGMRCLKTADTLREKKKRERKYKKGNMSPKGSENGSESIGIRIPAL